MGKDDIQTKATEIAKKVLTLGIGAVFLTEESIRKLVSDFKLPKELISGVLDSAAKTRKEFFQNLSRDLVDKVMDRVDIKDLATEILDRNRIRLSVEVEFEPKSNQSSGKK